jgi:8-oxo-dGTP diphosphatase
MTDLSPPPIPIHSPRHIVAVAGCVRDSAGRLLLVRTAWRGWEFPGGQVEQGEDPITALHREIREESGCTVTVQRLLGIYNNIGEPYIIQFLFACDYAGGDLCTSDETPDVGWFDPNAARALDLRPPTRLRLEDALSGSAAIAYAVYQVRPTYQFISTTRLQH